MLNMAHFFHLSVTTAFSSGLAIGFFNILHEVERPKALKIEGAEFL